MIVEISKGKKKVEINIRGITLFLGDKKYYIYESLVGDLTVAKMADNKPSSILIMPESKHEITIK